MKRKFSLIICLSLLAAFRGLKIGFSSHQAITTGIFCMSVLGIISMTSAYLLIVLFSRMY